MQAPARARDVSDVHGIVAANNSNMRSFRTISAILAATAPATVVVKSAEPTEHVADPLTLSNRQNANVLAREQYNANAASQIQYTNNAVFANHNQYTNNSAQTEEQSNNTVPSVLARFKNSANVNSVLIRNQNTDSVQPELLSAQSTVPGASNFQSLNSLLSLGQIQQARLILPIIQQDLAAQNRSANTNQMVAAYVQLLKQYSLNEEARFIQNTVAHQIVV